MLDAFHHSYMMLVAFYSASRLFMALYFVVLAFTVPMVRGMMITQAIITTLPVSLWLGSIYIELPARFGASWVAISLDMTLPILTVLWVRGGTRIFKRFGVWLDKVYEFYPAMNIEHRTERTNAFVGLVFGYSVVAILYQNAAHQGMNAFFGKAVLGLLQAFCFNWIYFELDGADLYQHAIRRSAWAGKLKRNVKMRDTDLHSFTMELDTSAIHHGLYSRCGCIVENGCMHRCRRTG